LKLNALDVANEEARLKMLEVTKSLVRRQFVKVLKIVLKLKKYTHKNTQFRKIQVLIVLVFCMFGFDTCLIIFSKFYIKFRTCITFSIHCYITYKAIQNILKKYLKLKNILEKTFQAKLVDRMVDRCLCQAKTVDHSVDRAFGQGNVHVYARYQSTDQSTANPCGRPTERA